MPLHQTIVAADDQSFEIAGVVRVLNSQPNASFMLLCPDGTWVPLPQPLLQVLSAAARAMMKKDAITLFASSSWLTTQEAADMMGYSRQVVVDLIKKKKLKASKLGSHRRIRLSDLLEFLNKEAQKDEALDQPVEQLSGLDDFGESEG